LRKGGGVPKKAATQQESGLVENKLDRGNTEQEPMKISKAENVR